MRYLEEEENIHHIVYNCPTYGELRKKFKGIDDNNERKSIVDLHAMENLLKNKDFINNYLKYIKEIYGETKVKSSYALIKKLLKIIIKSKV